MRASVLLLVLLAPAVAFAAAPRTFSDVTMLALTIIGEGTLVLMVGAVAIYFWSIASNMLKLSKGESAQWRSHFFWGVLAIFVMVSIWGIVQILQNTVFNTGGISGGPGGGSNCATFGTAGCGQ